MARRVDRRASAQRSSPGQTRVSRRDRDATRSSFLAVAGSDPGRTVFRRDAWLIAGAALAVRLAHLWAMRNSALFALLLGDARSYDSWAQQIASGDWLGHDVFYQAPLYAYF